MDSRILGGPWTTARVLHQLLPHVSNQTPQEGRVHAVVPHCVSMTRSLFVSPYIRGVLIVPVSLVLNFRGGCHSSAPFWHNPTQLSCCLPMGVMVAWVSSVATPLFLGCRPCNQCTLEAGAIRLGMISRANDPVVQKLLQWLAKRVHR